MSGNKFGLEFVGMNDVLKQLERMEADTKSLAEEALRKTFDAVQPGVRSAVESSRFDFTHRTGNTKAQILSSPKIEWKGNTAKVGVGFDVSGPGVVSVFLMRGTPRITPDQNLYNSVFGDAVSAKVEEVQRTVFEGWLEKA